MVDVTFHVINRTVSLTDDDVLEDVGVVVRCGCHLDTVRGNRKQQRTGMIHNFDVVFFSPHPA